MSFWRLFDIDNVQKDIICLLVKLTAHTSYKSPFNTYVIHESQNENKLIMIRDAATPITVEMEYEY